ncbi:hypothetical protein DBR32_13565 [Taibaiella sp. KBW10]|uniref:peptidylprolyl isomerase n=1 Tax=Taibaiella sp. KBW10 TaxID=2153357 RepID=UPI000F5A9D96|nr:peptidylprolyl isomerase [Taibaiella sp. KBW10]RQO29941.1 hypothetical protein DBR32_13565 [Taibaiella sp. KBW10]
MAIIQKIRDKYAKVAGAIIVLALVGFVLMDATSGGRNGGLFGKSTKVAEVDGTKIDYKEYEERIAAYENQMKQQNQPLDDNARAQARDQVFNQMVLERLTGEINQKLGVTVSDAELKDMFSANNLDPMVAQALSGGQQVDPAQIAARVLQLEKSKNPEEKAQWELFKQQLKEAKIQGKFSALVSGSVYTPKFILDDQHEGRANNATISYVNLPFTLIADDKVKVTDDDINKYINAHKKQFESKEETRAIEYVSFNILPSKDDSARVMNTINTLKAEFETTGDAEAFVKRNSDNPIPVSYQTNASLQQIPNAAEILVAAPGTIVGPFYMGDNVTIAKVVEKANFADSVKVRHILVMTKQGPNEVRTEAQAQARMDSVLAMEKSGANYDSLVVKFSDDYNPQKPDASKGEYDFTLAQKSDLAKEFGDFAFSDAGVGGTKVVKVGNDKYSGLHYIQILKKGKPVSSSKIAFVSKGLSADNTTYNTLYGQASQFAQKVSANAKSFDKEALASGVAKQSAGGISKNSFTVPTLGSSNDMVRWAYGAKLGDVSPIFTLGGNKFVVAKLSEINAEGILKPTGATKTALENYLKQQKKAQMLIDANKGKDLAAIAQNNQLQVAAADSVTFVMNAIPNVGNEPKLLGYIFNKNFKESTVSPGIAGMNGVYFVTVTKRFVNPAIGRNLDTERNMNDMMMKSNATQMIMQSVRESAQVKDLRGKLYN